MALPARLRRKETGFQRIRPGRGCARRQGVLHGNHPACFLIALAWPKGCAERRGFSPSLRNPKIDSLPDLSNCPNSGHGDVRRNGTARAGGGSGTAGASEHSPPGQSPGMIHSATSCRTRGCRKPVRAGRVGIKSCRSGPGRAIRVFRSVTYEISLPLRSKAKSCMCRKDAMAASCVKPRNLWNHQVWLA